MGQGIITIEARVEKIIFRKDDFVIFKTEGDLLGDGHTVKGHAHSLKEGMSVAITGEFVDDPNYGQQLKAKAIFPAVMKEGAPFDAKEMVEYLSSGIIAGLGVVKAKRIVEYFGERTEQALRINPMELIKVDGISEKLAHSIVTQWNKSMEVHDLFRFLSGHGLTLARSASIYETLGPGCAGGIKQNPYLLCAVDGIGFKIADAVAISVGMEKDSESRIKHGIEYFFETEIIRGNGSTGANVGELAVGASNLLDCPVASVLGVIEKLISKGYFTQDESGIIFHPGAYASEKSIAKDIARIHKNFADPGDSVIAAIKDAEVRCGLEFPLSDSQRQAIRKILQGSFSVLTGQPGTGKTTILRVYLEMMREHRVGLCAPAGKASKRMEEATGMGASTIHRLLEVDPTGGFVHNRHNKLDIDLLVMDESSMADVFITKDLLAAIPSHCKVLMVGDVDQLPSVGAGRVLGDIIDSGVLPVAKLTEIRRQGEGSGIIQAAVRINAGLYPAFTDDAGGFPSHLCATPDIGAEKIIELVTKTLPENGVPLDDIQVLCPGKNGAVGTIALNKRLQEILNPHSMDETKYLNVLDRKIVLGDRVIQNKNDHDRGIFNGDTGKVVKVDQERGEIVVDFTGTGPVTIAPDVLSRIELFYAGTIHKSQGSEFKHVVMPLYTQHFMLLKRNLFYTGVTRGKECVHLVTDTALKALGMAVRTEDASTRVTSLKSHIQHMFMKPEDLLEDVSDISDAPRADEDELNMGFGMPPAEPVSTYDHPF